MTVYAGHPNLRALVEQIQSMRLYEQKELRKMLGWDDERQLTALRQIIEMGDYVYKPHEFAEIARAALDAD